MENKTWQNILSMKTLQKQNEPYQNFAGFY